MTWTTIGVIWFGSGVVSALWHLMSERHVADILEYTKTEKILENFIVFIIALVAGPIGLVIKFYEDFIDTV
jgi:uncharacterized membrane protein